MLSIRKLRVHGALRQDDRGAVLVEYGYLIALVFIVAIVAVGFFGGSVVNIFDSAAIEFTKLTAKFL